MRAFLSLLLGSVMLNLSAQATAGASKRSSTAPASDETKPGDLESFQRQEEHTDEGVEGYWEERSRKFGLEKRPIPYIRDQKRVDSQGL